VFENITVKPGISDIAGYAAIDDRRADDERQAHCPEQQCHRAALRQSGHRASPERDGIMDHEAAFFGL
jgi:hypothetical protein